MKLKNLFLLGTLALLIGFTSCNKEDVEIVMGTWNFSKMEVNVQSNDATASTKIENHLEDYYNENYIGLNYTFYGNNLFSQDMANGIYSMKDNKLTLTYTDSISINEPAEIYTYSLSKKELKLSHEGDFNKDLIKELNLDPSLEVSKITYHTTFKKK